MNKKSSKKSFDSVYIFFEDLSGQIASLLNSFGFTPNQITILRFSFLALPACLLLVIGTHFSNIIAILLFFLNSFFDIVDGSLARNFDKKSKLGEFLDVNLDFVTFDFIFLAITLNLFLSDHPLKYFGLLAMFALPLSLKITDIFENRFFIVPIGGNETFHAFFSKSKPDMVSRILREMIYPTNSISYLFLTFRYLLVAGAFFNIVPLMLVFHSIVLSLRVVFLFLLLSIYQSDSLLKKKLVIVQALKKVDKKL